MRFQKNHRGGGVGGGGEEEEGEGETIEVDAGENSKQHALNKSVVNDAVLSPSFGDSNNKKGEHTILHTHYIT